MKLFPFVTEVSQRMYTHTVPRKNSLCVSHLCVTSPRHPLSAPQFLSTAPCCSDRHHRTPLSASGGPGYSGYQGHQW